jgi:hypothetical protein
MRVFPSVTLMAGLFFLGIYVGGGMSGGSTTASAVAVDNCLASTEKAIQAAHTALSAAAKSDAVANECLAMLRQDDQKMDALATNCYRDQL